MKNNNLDLSRRNAIKAIALGSASISLPAIGANNTHIKYDEEIPFQGLHQAGVITKEQKNATFIAFDITTESKQDLKNLFITITSRIGILTKNHNVNIPINRDRLPPEESGLLGRHINPDALTITVSIGNSLFDGRFNLHDLKPSYLKEMTSFPNDRLESKWCGGDIILQICANSPESVIYAVRDLIKHTQMFMAPKWKIDGFLPSRDLDNNSTPINLFGFKDGTGNAPADNAQLMEELVWVNNKGRDKNWCIGGSYQAIRLIRFNLDFWDRTPLEDQENDFGRHKYSGAPIGKQHEYDSPDYKSDPHGDRILFNSHIRRAEPRNPDRYTAKLRRRSFSYSLGVNASGMLDMGLIFVAYQQNLKTGFIDTQNRLNGEPLERYIKPFGGGYYFTLPGVKNNSDYLAKALFVDIS